MMAVVLHTPVLFGFSCAMVVVAMSRWIMVRRAWRWTDEVPRRYERFARQYKASLPASVLAVLLTLFGIVGSFLRPDNDPGADPVVLLGAFFTLGALAMIALVVFFFVDFCSFPKRLMPPVYRRENGGVR